MEQKIEKLKEIKTNLMIELEKAEVLLKICENETITGDFENTDFSIISRIAYKIILSSVKMVEEIEQVLIK